MSKTALTTGRPTEEGIYFMQAPGWHIRPVEVRRVAHGAWLEVMYGVDSEGAVHTKRLETLWYGPIDEPPISVAPHPDNTPEPNRNHQLTARGPRDIGHVFAVWTEGGLVPLTTTHPPTYRVITPPPAKGTRRVTCSYCECIFDARKGDLPEVESIMGKMREAKCPGCSIAYHI